MMTWFNHLQPSSTDGRKSCDLHLPPSPPRVPPASQISRAPGGFDIGLHWSSLGSLRRVDGWWCLFNCNDYILISMNHRCERLEDWWLWLMMVAVVFSINSSTYRTPEKVQCILLQIGDHQTTWNILKQWHIYIYIRISSVIPCYISPTETPKPLVLSTLTRPESIVTTQKPVLQNVHQRVASQHRQHLAVTSGTQRCLLEQFEIIMISRVSRAKPRYIMCLHATPK